MSLCLSSRSNIFFFCLYHQLQHQLVSPFPQDVTHLTKIKQNMDVRVKLKVSVAVRMFSTLRRVLNVCVHTYMFSLSHTSLFLC